MCKSSVTKRLNNLILISQLKFSAKQPLMMHHYDGTFDPPFSPLSIVSIQDLCFQLKPITGTEVLQFFPGVIIVMDQR